jgi:hypothetical protein
VGGSVPPVHFKVESVGWVRHFFEVWLIAVLPALAVKIVSKPEATSLSRAAEPVGITCGGLCMPSFSLLDLLLLCGELASNKFHEADVRNQAAATLGVFIPF